MREGWVYKKLGEVSSFSRGLTYSKNDVAVESSKKVLRSNNIDLATHSLIFDDVACLKEEFVIPLDKKLRQNDIFICMSNGSTQHLGKVAFIEKDIDYAFGGFMGAIHPQLSVVYPKFAFYYCMSAEYRRSLASVLNGININNLKWSDLSKFSIPIPPLSEQQRIVSELDLLSSIIEKKKAQLKEYDQLAQSIFYDMFGDPVTNGKGWEVKKLKQICNKITNGNTPKGGSEVYVDKGIMFFRSQNVWRNHISLDDIAYIDEETHKKLHNSSLCHNDILITKTGRFNTENSSLGRASIYEGNDNMANINGHVYLVRLKPFYLPLFVLYILISNSFKELIRSVCVGGIDKRQLNKNHIEDFPIILPPFSLQQSFAEKIKAIEKQKELIKQSITDMETMFNSRMDYYFA